MRGTKAKMLRRMAAEVGPSSHENIFTYEDRKGSMTRTLRLWTGCFRQTYKRLKREYKRASQR